ncbi:MAG: HD domain-containing protein [Lachnospiraceae bacterium]|nr:HD domain-containing protein [Lachnospiraceae bacterium]
MFIWYYEILFFISVILMIVYAAKWHKHFDVYYSILFTLIPITIMGNLMLARSGNLSEALLANKIVYIGASYLGLFMMFAVLRLCHIDLGKPIRIMFLVVSTALFLCALTMGRLPLFYESVGFERENGVTILSNKVYGPVHTFLYLMHIIFFVFMFISLAYSYFLKYDVPNRTIYHLTALVFSAGVAFFFGRMITKKIELLPLVYVIAQIILLRIIDRISMYDVTDTVIDSLVQTGDTGYISFDRSFRYLGSNRTAKDVFPELLDLQIDRGLDRNRGLSEILLPHLTAFRDEGTAKPFEFERGAKTYHLELNYLYDGPKKRGYQFLVKDYTSEHQYITMLNDYNQKLEAEVTKKTEGIVEMHDRLILGMATMVESRDNSTGGHIKRTSHVVRMLIDEIKKDEHMNLSPEFCKNLIKAAPMHDLGKIAVDDDVLRKPGRFTEEEYNEMKKHAAEGARIIHEILKDTEDSYFHLIAENVAHYHHERVDGSGYPEGLKGDEIPMEARIMAIADVYDALVSKRVYKERMSFEKADAIILEGMGTQFDKRLEPFYIAARPNLEAYYTSEGDS